jgi:hypothetical protein
MLDLIDIRWIGYKRDRSGKGHVWGYFFDKSNPHASWYPLALWHPQEYKYTCNIFWGRIGKVLNIKTVIYTYDFYLTAKGKRNNYREIELDKILSRWSGFTDEIEMFLLHRRLVGD